MVDLSSLIPRLQIASALERAVFRAGEVTPQVVGRFLPVEELSRLGDDPAVPSSDGSVGRPCSLATVFRPQSGLPFVGPDRVAHGAGLFHLCARPNAKSEGGRGSQNG